MSTFTQFTAEEKLEYDEVASRKYGIDLWKIVEGYRYYIGAEDSSRYIDIPTGYLTDGASIPRFLWWVLPPLGEYTQATTVHDYLCNTYEITEVINGVPTQVPVTRKEIDEILYEALRVLKVEKWKQCVIKAGVNLYRFVVRPKKPTDPVRIDK